MREVCLKRYFFGHCPACMSHFGQYHRRNCPVALKFSLDLAIPARQEKVSRDGLSCECEQSDIESGMDFPDYRIHGAAPGGREAELEAALVERDATIKALLERIAELERRLGLDSSNSGKPPSSDGLRKPNAGRGVEKRGKSSGGESSGRKPGGQPGRAGKTLKRSDEPDRVEDHYPDRCGSCGERLGKDGSVHFAARQVFDLPPPPALEVVEHRAHACACAACGGTTRAAFPEGVNAPIQRGSRISALVLYFGGLQMLPRKRLAEMMGEVFGASLSQGAVSAILRRGGEACASFAERVRDLVAHAPVKHMDETGVRVEGRLRWLHVACTGLLCHFRLGESSRRRDGGMRSGSRSTTSGSPISRSGALFTLSASPTFFAN